MHTRAALAILVASIVTLPSISRAQQIPVPPPSLNATPTRTLPGISALAKPTIVVGSPNIPDNPTAFDAINGNTPDSPLAGVVSVYSALSPTDGVRGSGVALDRYHILTAAHVVDFAGGVNFVGDPTGDGTSDALMPYSRVYVNSIAAPEPFFIQSVQIAPNWHGFGNVNAPDFGSNHDDLAILTLSTPLPLSVPTYPIYRTPFDQDGGQLILMTGYGLGGDAVNGITQPSSVDVKRYGWNITAIYERDDEAPGLAAEIYLADFDQPGPEGQPDFNHTGFDGFTSVGNDFESIIAPGDSGGPAFLIDDRNGDGFIDADELTVFGLTTFTFDTSDGIWPGFGSAFGGPILSAYAAFIDSIVPVPEPTSLSLLAASLPLLLKRRPKLFFIRP